MALQVWLPLNGDLKNKGCADITVTNNGATVDDNGKIGQCYSFGVNKRIYIDQDLTKLNPIQISFACWLYVSSWGTEYDAIISLSNGTSWTASRATLTRSGSTSKLVWNISDGTNTSRITTNANIQLDTWTHVVATYDGFNLKIYINGVLDNIGASTLNIAYDGKLCLGSWSNANNYPLNGKLNDVRVYDHCLSPAEVKEISRGLVLHYPLNRIITKNLLPALNTSNYIVTDYSSRTSGSIVNGVYHVDGYQSDTAIDTSFSITSSNFMTLNSDTDYYLRFYCRCKNNTSLYFATSNYSHTGLKDSSNNYYDPDRLEIGTEYNGYITLKIRTGSDTQYKLNLGFDVPNLYGIGSFIEFSDVTLSTIETDSFVDTNQDIVCDCSGYGNNGTVENGNLSIDYSSARYKNCYNFVNTYISAKMLHLPETTISFWINRNSLTNTRQFIYTGWYGISIELTASNGWQIYYTYNSSGSTVSCSPTTVLQPNTWYHVAVVIGQSGVKTYINGICEKTNTYQVPYYNANTVQIGNYSNYKNFNAKLSDFRVYATALSAEDVKQLYEVSGKIDKSGNLHSYEFNELHVGRELLTTMITTPYNNNTTPFAGFTSDGMYFEGTGSCGTNYIEISPTGKQYIYDYTISVSTGNQFYIGFERYDADKTSRSNQACTYTFTQKPTSDIVKKRYTGIVNLATDGTNPCKYIRLRILNGWSGTDSSSTKLATVHSLSLREVPTSTTAKTKLYKTGVFESDLLLEGNTKTEIEKNLDTNVNQLIEM